MMSANELGDFVEAAMESAALLFDPQKEGGGTEEFGAGEPQGDVDEGAEPQGLVRGAEPQGLVGNPLVSSAGSDINSALDFTGVVCMALVCSSDAWPGTSITGADAIVLSITDKDPETR